MGPTRRSKPRGYFSLIKEEAAALAAAQQQGDEGAAGPHHVRPRAEEATAAYLSLQAPPA